MNPGKGGGEGVEKTIIVSIVSDQDMRRSEETRRVLYCYVHGPHTRREPKNQGNMVSCIVTVTIPLDVSQMVTYSMYITGSFSHLDQPLYLLRVLLMKLTVDYVCMYCTVSIVACLINQFQTILLSFSRLDTCSRLYTPYLGTYPFYPYQD